TDNGETLAGNRVWASGGLLHLVSAVTGEARIYNMAGAAVKTVRCAAGETVRVPLPKGFYAVTLPDGKTRKLMIDN
ncbi:MAG: hypothetical protein LBK22_06970, partial [Tannerella sp.]|nr:hypothetical protein [Tannerella sp.]